VGSDLLSGDVKLEIVPLHPICPQAGDLRVRDRTSSISRRIKQLRPTKGFFGQAVKGHQLGSQESRSEVSMDLIHDHVTEGRTDSCWLPFLICQGSAREGDHETRSMADSFPVYCAGGLSPPGGCPADERTRTHFSDHQTSGAYAPLPCGGRLSSTEARPPGSARALLASPARLHH